MGWGHSTVCQPSLGSVRGRGAWGKTSPGGCAGFRRCSRHRSPSAPGGLERSCNPRGFVNTFPFLERVESLLPHRTSSWPHALPWAPSPTHGTGRLLPGHSTAQGRASPRCPGPAEQAEVGGGGGKGAKS